MALSLNLNAQNVSEEGGQNGAVFSAVQGGNPPYRYTWSNGSGEESIQELPAGFYTLTVFDYSNCSLSSTVQVGEPGPIVINSISSPSFAGGYNVSCHNANNGSINLSVSGGLPPYTYNWSHGAYTANVYDLGAGDYSVQISDDGGAMTEAFIYLSEPAPLTVSIASSPITCYNCNNGELNVAVSGGIPPYSYVWEHGAIGASLSGLSPGDYAVRVTAAGGCEANAAKTILQAERETWAMTGNAGTDPATNFIGTLDSSSLSIRTNNIQRISVEANGNIRIPALAGSAPQNLSIDEDGVLIGSPILDEFWKLLGNANTDSLINFVGTTDERPLLIRTNSQKRMKFMWDDPGYIGVATDFPKNMFVINSQETYSTSNPNLRQIGLGDIQNSELEFDSTGSNLSIQAPDPSIVGISTLQLINNSTGNTSALSGLTITMNGLHGYIKNHHIDGVIAINSIKGISLVSQSGNVSINAGNLARYFSNGMIFRNKSVTREILFQNSNNTNLMTIRPNGQVLIGTSEAVTGFKLAVRGKIRAEEIKVDVDAWGDFVFESEYKMKSISELEKFVRTNKHLPGIPTAAHLENNGLDLGEMQRLQMIKIEELTLYVIELQKQLNEIKAQK